MTDVVLGPGDGRVAPLDGVATEREGARCCGCLRPAHFKLHDCRVCATLNDSIQRGAARILHKLTTGDLELPCAAWIA